VPTASGTALFTIPHPFSYGLAFRWELLLPFAFLYVVSLLESLGDMTATSHLSGLSTEGGDHWSRMRGGILADALTCIASAIFGAFPSTTYAQNNGVIQLTGVASRRLGPLMALVLALLGLFPPVARWITAMPPAVLGALAILLFGMVAVSGLRLIMLSGLSQRDALIAAITLAVGIGFPSQQAWLATLPSGLKIFLESGVTCGGLTALLLNLILPRPRGSQPDASLPPG
jgi:NCS2 family nucleobase:cation symporter-2/xanthine permease XanP